jgi:hypothetical protein
MVGYKEWEAVCEELGSGRQCVLLRKGGIHEGREGFSFKHGRFALFPTRFHAQGQQLRVPFETSGGEWEPGDEVPLRFFCEAVWARTLSDWDVVQSLEPFHAWSRDAVRERFDCGEVQRIHCALVRVYIFRQPWSLPYEKKLGGCRTWIELPDPPDDWSGDLRPVLSDDDFARRSAGLEGIVAPR